MVSREGGRAATTRTGKRKGSEWEILGNLEKGVSYTIRFYSYQSGEFVKKGGFCNTIRFGRSLAIKEVLMLRPRRHEGYMHKRRKWPLKGWTKR